MNLKSLVATGEPVVVPFAWDPLSAKLAELAGAQAVFMSGYAVCTSLCMPDNGIVNQQEMVAAAARITRFLKVPLIVDADDGHGGPQNVRRTVEDFERAGVAALQIEDQPFPKRSGLLAGKQVLPMDDALRKIEAALRARRNPDLLVIGRTDAVEPLGLDAALERAAAFARAGCDLVLVTELPGQEGLRRYAQELSSVPKVYLGPPLAAGQLKGHGISLHLWSGAIRPAWMNLYNSICTHLRSGREAGDLQAFADVIMQATNMGSDEPDRKTT